MVGSVNHFVECGLEWLKYKIYTEKYLTEMV